MIGRTSRAAALAAIVATGGLVAGCGSSNKSAATSHVGGSAIAQAADVSGAASGEKIAMTISGQIQPVGTLNETGTGEFNRSPLAGELLMHMSIPEGTGAGGETFDVQTIIKNDTMYYKYGGAVGAELAQKTGKPWISIDYKQLGSDTGLSGLSSLFNSSMSQGPASQFQELEGASTNGLTKVGTATVNGVATTEYSATLNVDKEAATAPAPKRAALQQVLKTFSKNFASKDVPVKVWIDPNHMIRRYEMTESLLVQGRKLTMAITENILAYGAQPIPAAPPASQVDNLTSKVGQSLAANGTS